tara:strand:- start:94 stop:195 length:102 start_codon:yes stop_codon:yes gene_type:complete
MDSAKNAKIEKDDSDEKSLGGIELNTNTVGDTI